MKTLDDNFWLILLVFGVSLPLTAVALMMGKKDNEDFQEDMMEDYDDGLWDEKAPMLEKIEELERARRGSFYVSEWANLGNKAIASTNLRDSNQKIPSEEFSRYAMEASSFDSMRQASSSARDAMDWLMLHAVVSSVPTEHKQEVNNALQRKRGIRSAADTIHYVKTSYGPTKRKGHYLVDQLGWKDKVHLLDEIAECYIEASKAVHKGTARSREENEYSVEQSRRAAEASLNLIRELGLEQQYEEGNH